MKVWELIQQLSLHDGDSEVMIYTSRGTYDIKTTFRSDEDVRNEIDVVYIDMEDE